MFEAGLLENDELRQRLNEAMDEIMRLKTEIETI
jgi:hypothetical protein